MCWLLQAATAIKTNKCVGFKLQLGVDEVQNHLGMSREINVEIQTNYRTMEKELIFSFPMLMGQGMKH